jgi:hypothetical protein
VDIPTREEVQDIVDKDFQAYIRIRVEEFEEKWKGVEGAPMDMEIDYSAWDDRVDQILSSSKKVVLAEVEKVWGFGGVKVGDGVVLSSHNDYESCGVASILELGSTFLFSMEQDETLFGKKGKKELEVCDLFNYHSKFYPGDGEEFFDAMAC